MASLMILEPRCGGHHMQYVRWIAREALLRGHSVSLVTQAHCLNHPLYLTMQRECEGRIRATVFPSERPSGDPRGTVELIRRQFMYYRMFSTYFRNLPEAERPDLVFVPFLDYCVYAVGLLGSPFGKTPWGGLVMSLSFHFKSVSLEGPYAWLQ